MAIETNTTLGGLTFKLTRRNYFYFGHRHVVVSDADMRDRIRMAIEYDSVFDLLGLFKELGGNVRG